MTARVLHLVTFYSLLDRLKRNIGGARRLADCSGRMVWPRRGVYFFCEEGESRSHTGSGPRIVRVGTHAVSTGSDTKLWTRLSQHKGQRLTGGGNHRGSVFRQIVGTALIGRQRYDFPTWGDRSKSRDEVRESELALECEVSGVIGKMPFLWLAIDDEAGRGSLRSDIERNSIALLSNYERAPLDPPSDDWLGRLCNRELVRDSGLWNSDYVDERYDPAFLNRLDQIIATTEGAA